MNEWILRIAAALSTALWAFLLQGVVIGIAYALLRRMTHNPRLRYAAGVAALLAMPVTVGITALVAGLGSGQSAAPLQGGLPQGGPSWIFALWLLGEMVLALRWAGGWWLLQRLSRAASDEVPLRWHRAATDLARSLGIRGRLRLRLSERVATPFVFGWLRPVLILPRNLEAAVGFDGVRALLAHELAHIARHDTRVLALQRLVETLLFYHPVCWWISRKVTDDREYCTDDLAVDILGNRQVYARALAALEASRSDGPTLAVAAHGGNLMSRLLRLTRDDRPAPAGPFAPLLLAGGFAAVLLAGTLVATPLAQEIDIPWLPESVARWNPLFEQAAAEHGVDAELLAIMALLESKGNPDAVSSLGATGIMQVLPSTAKIIAHKRGMTLEPGQLADPQTNIDLAAWYLAKHQQEFVSSDPLEQVEWLAAAYNGGEGALRRHLQDGTPLSAETDRYRIQVRSMWAARDKENAPGLKRRVLREGKPRAKETH